MNTVVGGETFPVVGAAVRGVVGAVCGVVGAGPAPPEDTDGAVALGTVRIGAAGVTPGDGCVGVTEPVADPAAGGAASAPAAVDAVVGAVAKGCCFRGCFPGVVGGAVCAAGSVAGGEPAVGCGPVTEGGGAETVAAAEGGADAPRVTMIPKNADVLSPAATIRPAAAG